MKISTTISEGVRNTRNTPSRLSCVFSNLGYSVISAPVQIVCGGINGVRVTNGDFAGMLKPVAGVAGMIEGLVIGGGVTLACLFEAATQGFATKSYRVPKAYAWMIERNRKTAEDLYIH